MLLYIDRMSSTVRPYDPSSLMIDNSKKEALNLSDDDIARILEGKQIECMVNGQQAYLLINPNEKSVSATLEKAPFRESWEMPGTELKASETESVYKDYSQNDSEVKNGRNLGV